MTLRDSWGWPVERFKGRPIINLIRLLLHTDIRWTWRRRAWVGMVGPAKK